MSSRFTLNDAKRIAKDCGLHARKATALLTVLQDAEVAHDTALSEQTHPDTFKAQAAQHREFAAAANSLHDAWVAMDGDSRAGLAWLAVFSGAKPFARWLDEAYGRNCDLTKVTARLEEMMLTLQTVARYELPPGPKKKLHGLEAAAAAFKKSWRAMAGENWYPRYSRSRKGAPPEAEGTDAKVLWAFAQKMGPYNLVNCRSATGSHGENP